MIMHGLLKLPPWTCPHIGTVNMPDTYALIPAAGSGSRMGAELPKQYQNLAGQPLIRHTISMLCAHARVKQVYVVLASTDNHFRSYDWSAFGERVVPLYCGGATRANSVVNGLMAMTDAVDADDWVLVHDAARPCLTLQLMDRLFDEIGADSVGGLLAVPVADTLKRADASCRASTTVAREGLWQAQTPQMFRYRLLLEALRKAPLDSVTDEASAIEQMGLKPKLVMGSAANIKVTWPNDSAVVEILLKTIG